jgi:hemolysin III
VRSRLFDHNFAAKAIYGLVTVLALLLVMEDHPPEALPGAISLFGATLAVALLDLYAESVAEMLSHSRRLTQIEIRKVWEDVRPVLIGAQAPTLIMLLSALGLFSVETAIDFARVVIFLTLFLFGIQVGRKLHENVLRQLLSGLYLVALAGLIVGIKVLFH